MLGDGKELWHSGGLKKGDGHKTVKVDVKNVKRLMLRVQAGRVKAVEYMRTGWMRSVSS